MKPLTSVAITIVILTLIGAVAFRSTSEGNDNGTVTVVHWTTGHLLRTGSGLRLLEQMAKEFNVADHRTSDGRDIRIEVHYQSGALQEPELISRITRGVALDEELPSPTLVTPSASHWLVNVNREVGHEVVDLSDTESRSIARTYVGIVTSREMATCLGWPARQIGYADIIALRDDPRGWSAYPCASATWGQKPLLAFTDPTQSDTGRAVLLTLYAIATDKDPEDLTLADVHSDRAVSYVEHFQSLVDHYMVNTSVVNTKVHQGPRFGHFFIMPEDNLIHLKDGTETAYIDGVEQDAPPLERSMVMIYPKEGSLLRENCACLVKAPWVTPEQVEGYEQWVKFLREDEQQRSFMAAGFRPGTSLSTTGSKLADPKYGLTMATPDRVLHAERVDPAVAKAIDDEWQHVKRPAIVTVVADRSGSMEGQKIREAKDGLARLYTSLAQTNQVGFISFSDTITEVVPIAPLQEVRYTLTDAADAMRTSGGTALYSAVQRGIEMSDSAPGPEGAIRAVIVLTDGKANQGIRLDNILKLSSRQEQPVTECSGFEKDTTCRTPSGNIPLSDVLGASLYRQTNHDIQVFFVGFGDADIQIGRILAEATGAEYHGATEKDLAEILEVLGKYF